MKLKKLILLLLSIFNTCFVLGQNNKIEQIKLLVNEKQFDTALAIIDNLIEKKEATNLVYYYKAFCEDEKKIFESSILSATTALKMTAKSDSLYPDILFMRSLSYLNSGNLRLAIEDNEIIAKDDPYNINYLVNLSYLYGENKQFYNCIKTLHQALEIDSLNVFILNNLAYYYNETAEYSSAQKYAGKGLKITNDSVWVASLLNSLGFAESKIISAEKGIQTIQQSIAYRPNNPYAYYNLGIIFLSKNEIEEACKNFAIAKKLGGLNMTAQLMNQYCK